MEIAMLRKREIKAASARKDEELREVRGGLAEALIELQNKTDMLRQIAAHRLERVMGDMIDLTHEGRKK